MSTCRSTFPFQSEKAVRSFPKQMLNTDFLRKQPIFSLPLPGLDNAMGFQVSGHDMEELIQPHDYVIGSRIDGYEQLSQGNIYVIITSSQVIVKRLKEIDGRMLTLGSDNPDYGIKGVAIISVKEIWEVRYIVSGSMRQIRGTGSGKDKGKKDGKREFEG
ncbi:MAG: S24 family peptidase [Bacteroidota bacterium]